MMKTHADDILDQLAAELQTAPRPGRLEVGWRAHEALSELRRPDEPWADVPLAAVFGVPVVPSRTLLPSQWRLLDVDGELVDDGIVP